MAARSHGVELDLKPLMKLRKDLEPAVERAIDRTLVQWQETAKEHAHVISGSMAAGLYTAKHGQSGYAAAVSAARAKLPTVDILPEVGDPPPGTGVGSNVTAQSVYEEFGTVKHGPHPFMMPAAIESESNFPTNLENEIRKILPP